MKKIISFVLFLAFASVCPALDYSANLKVQTGDTSLDLHLSNVNAKAATPAGATQIKTELIQYYSVSDKQIKFLNKQGYTLAEIQYLALLAKQSGKSIESVAALRSKGIGWGVLAKRLGVQPSALRKKVREERAPKVKIERREQGPRGGGRGRNR